MIRRKVYLLSLFLLFVQDIFGQCAMCRAVAEESPQADGGKLNQGILYIMVIPYIILFFIFRKKIFRFLRELRDAKQGG